MTTAVWKEDAVTCGPLVAHLGANPDAGVQAVWSDQFSLSKLLSVSTPAGPLPKASESYQRGVDSFSLHPASDAFPFRTQLGWSATPCVGVGVRLTLTVSLQTDLLDTRPNLMLTTSASAEPIAGNAAWRVNAQPGATLIVGPHPSDAAETSALLDETGLRLTLSPPFLEKGVIRRCRVAAIWLPADVEQVVIDSALQEFAMSPLPLTA